MSQSWTAGKFCNACIQIFQMSPFQKVLFSAKEKDTLLIYNTMEDEHCLYAPFRDIMNHKYE